MRRFRSRTNWCVNLEQPDEFFDYDLFEVNWTESLMCDYRVGRQIGHGTFGSVFEATDKLNCDDCVFKRLKPTPMRKIKLEVKVLRYLKNGPNIIKLRGVIQESLTDIVGTLIFDHVDGDTLTIFQRELSKSKKLIRYYSYELLKALEFCHRMGVMHRDLKLSNVMINDRRKQLKLIDFGSAEFYRPRKQYSPKIGALCYMGPELLLQYPYYDYSVDMWAFGCIFGSLIFKERHFFTGKSKIDMLISIVKVRGTDDLHRYAQKCNVPLDFVNILKKKYPRKKQESLGRDTVTSRAAALDLLDRLFKYDPSERITARAAMEHSFFTRQR